MMPRSMQIEQHGREASTRVEFVRFDLVRRSTERSGNEVD